MGRVPERFNPPLVDDGVEEAMVGVGCSRGDLSGVPGGVVLCSRTGDFFFSVDSGIVGCKKIEGLEGVAVGERDGGSGTLDGSPMDTSSKSSSRRCSWRALSTINSVVESRGWTGGTRYVACAKSSGKIGSTP